jgi:two-component system, OmpR family, response regulator
VQTNDDSNQLDRVALLQAGSAGRGPAAERPLDILVVDDERTLREPLAQYLSRNQCRVAQAQDALSARKALGSRIFDLVVLDIMMPGEDGLSLCRYICEILNIPVMLLTARTEDADRIVGLELGADDYMVKPFNPRELLARARAIIRRARALPPSMRVSAARTIRFGDWTLRTTQREIVAQDGVVVPLTSREFIPTSCSRAMRCSISRRGARRCRSTARSTIR